MYKYKVRSIWNLASNEIQEIVTEYANMGWRLVAVSNNEIYLEKTNDSK